MIVRYIKKFRGMVCRTVTGKKNGKVLKVFHARKVGKVRYDKVMTHDLHIGKNLLDGFE